MIATIAMRKQLNTISVDQGKGGNESIIMQLHLRGYCTNNETNKKKRASIANKIAQSRVSGLHEQISFGEWLTTLALRLTLRPKSPGVKRTHDRTHARVRTHILYAKDLTRMAKWLQCVRALNGYTGDRIRQTLRANWFLGGRRTPARVHQQCTEIAYAVVHWLTHYYHWCC